jgi:hypothetical protein
MLQRDLDAAWVTIGVATVDDKEQKKGWAYWQRDALAANINPISEVWTSQAGRTSSLPLPPKFELGSTEKVGKLDINRWSKPSVISRKPSSLVGTMTQEKCTTQKS